MASTVLRVISTRLLRNHLPAEISYEILELWAAPILSRYWRLAMKRTSFSTILPFSGHLKAT